MQGQVKMFNEKQGYGFITGEDGDDYFVHISEVAAQQKLYKDLMVSFEPSENEKGKIAKKVTVIKSKIPKFINIANLRLKLSDIKNYGIHSCYRYFKKVYRFKENVKFFSSPVFWAGNIAEVTEEEYYNHNYARTVVLKPEAEKHYERIDVVDEGDYIPLSDTIKGSDYLKREVKCLHIELSRNRSITVMESSKAGPNKAPIEVIMQICEKLDKYLCK